VPLVQGNKEEMQSLIAMGVYRGQAPIPNCSHPTIPCNGQKSLREADKVVKEAIANAHELRQAFLLEKAASDPNPNTAAVLRRIQEHETMKAD
jgi:hypothetical protein